MLELNFKYGEMNKYQYIIQADEHSSINNRLPLEFSSTPVKQQKWNIS